MNLEQKFIEIIERKHRELNLGKDYSQKFSYIRCTFNNETFDINPKNLSFGWDLN